MNNKTICRFEIRMRGDNVYDLYVNKKWVASRGHYESILDEIRNEIKRIDNESVA